MHDIEVVFAALAALAYLRRRFAKGRAAPLDRQRRYTEAQRAAIFARSGGRCEHKSAFWFRCPRRATHADHMVPWSRGGSTTIENAQALCAFHNLSKGAKLMSRSEVARLERRRRNY